MTTTLQSLNKMMLFIVAMILVSDIGGAFYMKENYKGGIDFCVKSASMELVRDNDFAKGIIKIDETRSKEEFKEMMQLQFNLTKEQVEEGIVYSGPVNTVPSTFTHPIKGTNYTINKPMFIVIYRLKRDGIFINNTILIDNLSGSQVTVKPK